MQTAIEPKHSNLGILPVQTRLLEQVFCLPEGYRIVSVSYDPLYQVINFTLMSEDLPEVKEDCSLPQLRLHVCYEILPDQDPQYRKITTEVKVQGQ